MTGRSYFLTVVDNLSQINVGNWLVWFCVCPGWQSCSWYNLAFLAFFEKGLILLLIFHDYFIAEGVFVDILLVECEFVRSDVVFVILKSVEAVSNYIDFS